MKQGTVKYSKEFKTANGSVWLGLENEYDMNSENPISVFERVEQTVHQFAKSSGLVLFTPIGVVSPAPPMELPVINKSEERLGILLENADTIDELMTYKNQCSTVYLAGLWTTRLSQLHNK